MKEFEISYLEHLKKNHPKVLSELKSGKLTDKVIDTLNETAQTISGQY